MGLTDTKITFFGPFDLDLLVAGEPDVSQYARTGLKEDAIVINMPTAVGEREAADGSKRRWVNGRDIIIEIFLSEIDPTATTGDMVKIEAADKLTIDFLEANAASDILTIETFDKAIVDVEGGRMKITIYNSGDLAKGWSDLISLA